MNSAVGISGQRATIAAATVCLVLAITGCSDPGEKTAPPSPGATAPPSAPVSEPGVQGRGGDVLPRAANPTQVRKPSSGSENNAEVGPPAPEPGTGPGPELPPPYIPTHVSPADRSVLTHHPRDTTLTWRPVPGAAYYSVEVECLGCATVGVWSPQASTTTDATSHSFTWPGDNDGRWRVTAIAADGYGSESDTSPWWHFTYDTSSDPGEKTPPPSAPVSEPGVQGRGGGDVRPDGG